jgi:putative NADH-flavin reductase
MNIMLFGATGNIGQRIYSEAVSRGHQVAVFVRPERESRLSPEPAKVASGDVTNPDDVAAAVEGQSAVISALGPRGDVTALVPTYRSLVAGLTKAGVRRLLVVGGAGSLEAAPGVPLFDSPEFPKEWLAIAKAHGEVLEFLKTTDLDWTYISPPALIQPGKRTGHYIRGENQLLVDANGKSEMSAEDYAVALVDELENGQAIRKRITFAW